VQNQTVAPQTRLRTQHATVIQRSRAIERVAACSPV
jgi:hypothetical protein